MWMLEVTVPIELEEPIDHLVGETNFIYQCWGQVVDSAITLKYAFREEGYARTAESRISQVTEAVGLRVWEDPLLYVGDTRKSLTERVMEGDVAAAGKWLRKKRVTVYQNNWWYWKLPIGVLRKMSDVENRTHMKALELTQERSSDAPRSEQTGQSTGSHTVVPDTPPTVCGDMEGGL